MSRAAARRLGQSSAHASQSGHQFRSGRRLAGERQKLAPHRNATAEKAGQESPIKEPLVDEVALRDAAKKLGISPDIEANVVAGDSPWLWGDQDVELQLARVEHGERTVLGTLVLDSVDPDDVNATVDRYSQYLANLDDDKIDSLVVTAAEAMADVREVKNKPPLPNGPEAFELFNDSVSAISRGTLVVTELLRKLDPSFMGGFLGKLLTGSLSWLGAISGGLRAMLDLLQPEKNMSDRLLSLARAAVGIVSLKMPWMHAIGAALDALAVRQTKPSVRNAIQAKEGKLAKANSVLALAIREGLASA